MSFKEDLEKNEIIGKFYIYS